MHQRFAIQSGAPVRAHGRRRDRDGGRSVGGDGNGGGAGCAQLLEEGAQGRAVLTREGRAAFLEMLELSQQPPVLPRVSER